MNSILTSILLFQYTVSKMFDVFQNVLFGKKKSNADAEKEKSISDDFVMIGQTSNDQAPMREAEPIPNERLFPVSPHNPY